MATCWFTILYIMVKRDSFLLVSSDFHFRSSSRSVTLDLCVMVQVFDKSCAPPLDHFNFVDVYPFMWVPDAAGEFNCWPNHRHVCGFFGLG